MSACTDPAASMGADLCPQHVLLSTAHLNSVTGGRCHGDGGWTALYWGARFTCLLILEPTAVSSQLEGPGREERGLPGDGPKTGSSLSWSRNMAEAVWNCLQDLASAAGPHKAEPRLRQ